MVLAFPCSVLCSIFVFILTFKRKKFLKVQILFYVVCFVPCKINYISTFDVEFKNSNADYQTFQRNILSFNLQRRSNSTILHGKHVKMYNQRNCNCDAELKSSLFQPPLIKLKNGSLSKHPINDANFFFVFALYQIINSCEYHIY